jgi:hypothetical protein
MRRTRRLSPIIAISIALTVTSAANGRLDAHLAASCHAHDGLPDQMCTPGVRDHRVTQKNIGKTICRSGYSASVRPPSSYTKKLKKKQMKQYGYYAGKKTSSYEEDHLISLELGGAPRSSENLWPEAFKPKPGARQKDTVENYLHRRVCAGKMKLATAQRREARNWLQVYHQLP